MFLLFFAEASSRTSAENFLNDVDGIWRGKLTRSEKKNDEILFKNVSVSFSTDLNRNFTSVTIKSPDGIIDEVYFLKIDEEDKESVILASRFNDDIGRMKVLDKKDAYILRGLIAPKNDQLTGLIRSDSLVFSITDQFSTNVTTLTLKSEGKESNFPYYMQLALFLITGVVIIISIYKVTDLTDVIKPEEARYTEMVKAKSLRDAKLKEAKEIIRKHDEEEKKKAEAAASNKETEGKIETE